MAEDGFKTEIPLKAILFILGVMVLAVLAQGVFRAGSPPDINIKPAMSAIGKKTPVTIELTEPRRGLTFVKVELVQGDKIATVVDKSYPASSQIFFWKAKTEKDVLKTEVGRGVLPQLTGGSAVIRVTAGRANTWLRHPGPVVEEVSLPVKLTPPSLQVTSTQTYVAQGGCEAVTYRVGDSAVRDGVRAGSWWFPGYPLPGGGKQDRFAIFASPYDMAAPDARLVVADAAGNESEHTFIDKFYPHPFRTDNVIVDDAFFNNRDEMEDTAQRETGHRHAEQVFAPADQCKDGMQETDRV